MPRLKLFLFGYPRIEVAEHEVAIHRRKAMSLIVYLAVTKVRHQRETLAALFWPESDRMRAHGSLRRHISELNGAGGHKWVDADRETVRLHQSNPFWIDVDEFQGHLRELPSHSHSDGAVGPEYISSLTAASELYCGDFLAGFSLPNCREFDEWQFFRAGELRRSFDRVLDHLIAEHLREGNIEAAIPHSRRRVGLDPLAESAHRQLMSLYMETGERNAAMRQYEQCASILKKELNVSPTEESIALYDRIRRGDLQAVCAREPRADSSCPRHNLPAQTTPLIGRTEELAEIVRMFADPAVRLVTILGPGGMGKSRFALEAARNQLEQFADGVYVASLAPVSEAGRLVPSIAAAVGFQFHTDERSPDQQLSDYLSRKQMLLLLDNFEHVLEGVDLVQELLGAGPSLRILATSRERLHLSGETIYRLNSLKFPTWETPKQALQYSAIQLFVQTARRVRPEFEPGASEIQYVARICRLVGGMPLGIILAGSWVSVLSPAEIAEELTRGFDFLETEMRDLPDRQRNMRAVLAYSWQRLTAAERECFGRLSVFRGGFTREAAQAIAGVSLGMLSHLVDKSFVQGGSNSRYDIHELLRQYAAEKLRDSGQKQHARDAHCAYYLDFVGDREAALTDHRQLGTLTELATEFENIRAAWHHAVQERDCSGIDRALDGLFWWFWLARNNQHEGQALLCYALERWQPAPEEELQPVWMRISARTMEQSGPRLTDDPERIDRVKRALEGARKRNDRAETAFCQWALGRSIHSKYFSAYVPPTENLESPAHLFDQSLKYCRECNDQFFIAQILEDSGRFYRTGTQIDEAIVRLQESLEIRRTLGDRLGVGRSLRELGFAFYVGGLNDETERAWREGYEIRRETGDQQGIADSLFFLNVLLQIRGDWREAKALVEQLAEIVPNVDESVYHTWAERAFEIATCMEQAARDSTDATAGFPNAMTPFSAHFIAMTYGQRPATIDNCHRALDLATTDEEISVCLPFAAHILAQEGDRRRAVHYLALALRLPCVSEGWIGRLPEIVNLREQLTESIGADDYRRAWEGGQKVDLKTARDEILDKLRELASKALPGTALR